jgi:hypothetical protein
MARFSLTIPGDAGGFTENEGQPRDEVISESFEVCLGTEGDFWHRIDQQQKGVELQVWVSRRNPNDPDEGKMCVLSLEMSSIEAKALGKALIQFGKLAREEDFAERIKFAED